MSAAELSRQLKVPTNRIPVFSTAAAPFPVTRLCASPFFRNERPFLAQLQSLYDIRLAEQKTGRTIRPSRLSSGPSTKPSSSGTTKAALTEGQNEKSMYPMMTRKRD